MAVRVHTVEGGGTKGIDIVVVDIHGEGREVANAALPVGGDLVAGFRGVPGDAGKGFPPL